MSVLLESHELGYQQIHRSMCTLPQRKSKSSSLPSTDDRNSRMTKIAIDLVTECETSSSGNKHILTIIDYLTEWPEAFPIPDKSADTIVSTFINHYLPVHMYPRHILLDNGMKFKNHLMDQVLQQLGTNCIFSAPCQPQSNGKLEVFHKYLKAILKKLCEKDPSNWDKYMNQVLTSYRVMPNLATAETLFFLTYGRDPSLPLHQLLELMQLFLGDPKSVILNLETHHPALAIAKKTLYEHHFRTAKKTTDREPPSFKIDDRVYFKNKQPGKWDLKCRPGYRTVHTECDQHHLHIENQATGKTRSFNVKDVGLKPLVELWNIDTQFGRAGRYINLPANLPTIMLID